MWHKPCRTFHPWCPCIKTRCLCHKWCQLCRHSGTADVIKATCGATSDDNVDIMRQTAELSHYVQRREVGIRSWKFSKNNLIMCRSGQYKPISMIGNPFHKWFFTHNSNLVLLQFSYSSSDRFKMLHMPRQLYNLGMCRNIKFVWQ